MDDVVLASVNQDYVHALGDSGGPLLAAINGAETIVGVNSTCAVKPVDGWNQCVEGIHARVDLEELSFDLNFVSSVEPLRRLVANGRGRLDKVSLENNCVTDCSALASTEHNCIETAACESPITPAAASLSVPIDFVTQYAPAFSEKWTPSQVAYGFELLKNAASIS